MGSSLWDTMNDLVLTTASHHITADAFLGQLDAKMDTCQDAGY